MTKKQKNKTWFAILFLAIALVFMVLSSAFYENIQHDNNGYARSNAELQGEIDTLKIKVKASNNIDSIERTAIQELGMVYPSEDQCIYLTENDKPEGGFAAVLKRQAYN